MELHNAVKEHGSISAAARALEIPRTTFKRMLEQERKDSFTSFIMPEPEKIEVSDQVQYFILTYAQDKTEVHLPFWNNLVAYADYLDARIFVGGGTYSKKLFQEADPSVRSEDVWFADEIDEFVVHDPIALGDGLIFCAEMNTIPTATSPLSGLEAYTKDKWGIFPHAKVQLRSIATMKNEPAKQIMTTGTVTLPNYIRKKAGIKAQFHHIIGAVIVSLAPDGAFFCRHIIADDEGSFYDLDRFVFNGEITTGNRPEAIVHGDIHIEKVDPVVAKTSWSYSFDNYLSTESLTSVLRPKRRVFHDLIDFSARNHHNIDDHHLRIESFYRGQDSVEQDLYKAVHFLNEIQDPEIEDFVIQSNHDNALVKWLKNPHVRYDPENYLFWLETETKYVKALIENRPVHLFREVLEGMGVRDTNLNWIREDEDSLRILGVELGIHGHNGANGARGSAQSFAKMGPKSITGHVHAPSITDGHMSVGTNSKMDMGYNKGLSSWAHANALLDPNGQRTIITMSQGRWFD